MLETSTTEVYNRAQNVFRRIFDEPSFQIRPDMCAADVDGWDSLVHLQLMLAIEKEFRIRFQISEVADVKNVGELLNLIQIKLRGA